MNAIPDFTVFYDGDCGFCNKSVAYILKYEREPKIQFISLQSDLSKEFFKSKGLPNPNLSSVVFLRKDELLNESTASLYLAKELRFPHNLNFGFIIIPRFIRDFIYSLIAKNRHRLYKSYCISLDEQTRERFLN